MWKEVILQTFRIIIHLSLYIIPMYICMKIMNPYIFHVWFISRSPKFHHYVQFSLIQNNISHKNGTISWDNIEYVSKTNKNTVIINIHKGIHVFLVTFIMTPSCMITNMTKFWLTHSIPMFDEIWWYNMIVFV